MVWIYSIPAWIFISVAMLVLPGLAAAGLLATRRWFPQSNQITHNDVAGPIVATLGTILAVVISFMVVTVWQEFDAAAATVQTEVSAICDLYHDASILPQPQKSRVQSELARYVTVVVRDEWPLMRRGGSSDEARSMAFRMMHIIADLKPKNEAGIALQTDMVALTHTFNDARRQRLFDNQQSIPITLWVMILFITALTIVSTYLFRVASIRAHLAMIVALTAAISSILVLIVEFDLPFRGDIQVAPVAFQHAFLAIAEDPPNSEYSPNAPK